MESTPASEVELNASPLGVKDTNNQATSTPKRGRGRYQDLRRSDRLGKVNQDQPENK